MFRVVVADDDALFLGGLKRHIPWEALALEPVGWASDGVSALELCRDCRPDIAVLDVRMPRMGGTELATRIREELPGCQILFVSAYTDVEYLKSAIRLQAADYVEKPVDRDELVLALRRIIERLRCARGGRPGEPSYGGKVGDVIRYLDAHHAGDTRVRVLANLVRVTPNYLSNLFR